MRSLVAASLIAADASASASPGRCSIARNGAFCEALLTWAPRSRAERPRSWRAAAFSNAPILSTSRGAAESREELPLRRDASVAVHGDDRALWRHASQPVEHRILSLLSRVSKLHARVARQWAPRTARSRFSWRRGPNAMSRAFSELLVTQRPNQGSIDTLSTYS